MVTLSTGWNLSWSSCLSTFPHLNQDFLVKIFPCGSFFYEDCNLYNICNMYSKYLWYRISVQNLQTVHLSPILVHTTLIGAQLLCFVENCKTTVTDLIGISRCLLMYLPTYLPQYRYLKIFKFHTDICVSPIMSN